MVRICNKEIPGNKNVAIALTYIHGIGKFRANQIVENCDINPNLKAKKLDEEQIKKIDIFIKDTRKYTVEEKLKEQQQKIISSQIKLGTYHGLRRARKPNPLPIRGQRTRHNARTAKGHKRITVANKKKAPTPK